jgi:hypothetical protein
MEGNYVGMSDYEGLTGFGLLPQMQIEEIHKALSAGYQQPRHDGGSALRVESLEATLRILTFSQAHVKLWKDIPKLPAYSTNEEYTIQTSYGGENGPFTREGELPQVQDASYERRVELIKYLGTQREVTHPATLVRNAYGNIIARETQNGAVWLMERLERSLFRGMASVVPESFDGIDEQILRDPRASAQNVLDLRGGPLTEAAIEEATNIIVENYGLSSALYLAPRAQSDVSKQFYNRQRGGFGDREGRIGYSAKMMETNAGDIALRGNMFLRSGKNNGIKTAPSAATSVRAATAPTVAGVAGANAGSIFATADAGTYQYKVCALNRFGESAAAQEASGVAVVSGDGVTLTITDGGGADAATGYRIYRSKAGGAVGSEQMMIDIPRPRGAATTVFVDINQFLPGTSRAYLLQMNLQSISFRQLAPMMKIPLATLAASIRWMQLIYGTPIVYAPLKNLIFLNVADD